jgi:hypothetical protein
MLWRTWTASMRFSNRFVNAMICTAVLQKQPWATFTSGRFSPFGRKTALAGRNSDVVADRFLRGPKLREGILSQSRVLTTCARGRSKGNWFREDGNIDQR